MATIGVAIVTYNRLEKLKTALQSYALQTLLPAFVVVVNNKSTDGTLDYLKEWIKKDDGFVKKVITTQTNIGGAGGFYEAMKESMEYDFDLLWISDDDAYPEKNSLMQISNYFRKTNKKIGAICGAVVENGLINVEHRNVYPKHRVRFPFGIPAPLSEYEKDEFKLDIFSYVGTAISRNALEKCGLTKKEYFIWCDDAEHSMRISKCFEIICLPSVRIIHDVDKTNGSSFSWKTYYGIRNRFDAIKHNGTKNQFLYHYLSYLKAKFISFFKNKAQYRLIKTAFYDYKHKNFGISPIYKPGTKL